MHQVDEIRCFARVYVRRRHVDGLSIGRITLGCGDRPSLHHGVQHDVAPFRGAIRVPVGGEVIGPLHHSCQQGTLGQVQLLQVLAEVGLCRLAEPIDGKRTALPQVDLVGIHLEDLLLGKATLELVRDHDLGDLARDRLFRRKKKTTSQLLRDRRPAAAHAVRQRVLHGTLHGADIVDAGVFEEAAIFDRKHGLHHARRDSVIGHHAAFGAVFVLAECGNELRFKFVGTQRGAVVGRNGLHRAVGCGDRGAFGCEVALRPRLDGDRVRTQLKRTHGAALIVTVVACPAQPRGDASRGQALPWAHLLRRGIDLRG